MAVEFKTIIRSMERYVADGFVYSVTWEMLATEGNFTVSRPGQLSFTREEGVSITAFNTLTEADILAWITDRMDAGYVNTIKQSMTSELAQLTAPKTTATGLPLQMVSEDAQPPV
jgi:hypothetical protein